MRLNETCSDLASDMEVCKESLQDLQAELRLNLSPCLSILLLFRRTFYAQGLALLGALTSAAGLDSER